jgi:membrane protease YdiL (CAAX protease family)
MNTRRIALFAPVGIIGLGLVTAVLSRQMLDPSVAWLPPVIVYWLSLATAIALLRGFGAYRHWLQPSQGRWGWLALLNPIFIIIPTVIFFGSLSLTGGVRVLAWVLITIMNPIVEEGFWRATLMDASRDWPWSASILYSAVWFGLSHPLVIGINIALAAGVMAFIGKFINGLIWSLVYERTKSLRWSIATNILANVFSIGIFLGIITLNFD